MKIKAKQDMWLSNPTNALCLNMEDGKRFFNQINLTDIDMTSCGWVKIGSAEITMTIEMTPGKMALAAVEALQLKLREKDAEHEKLRNAMLDAIGKLSSLTYEGGRA